MQHEIHHFYEYVQKKGQPMMSDRYQVLYKNVRKENGGKYTDTGDEKLNKSIESKIKILDAVLYVSFNIEINAFLNSFDALLRDSYLQPNGKIYQSQLFDVIKIIRNVVEDWQNYEDLVERAYGIKSKVCLNILNNALNRYYRGIARLLVKHKKIDEEQYDELIHDRDWYRMWRYLFDRLDEDIKKREKQ